MSFPTIDPARFQTSSHPALKLDDISINKQHELLHDAGKIAARVRKHIASKVKPNASVLDLCMEADKMILDEGAIPAFPINISINNTAAHYTAMIDDTMKIPEKGVVKVDVGVAIDGFIADTAHSVDIDGNNKKLIQATIDATTTAIQIIRPGTMTGDLGGVIEKIIREAGFNPVKELSGHLIKRYVVHGGKTIPLIGYPGGGDRVEEGEVYAIETFASTGDGSVHPDFNSITIFRASPLRVKARGKNARKIHQIATKVYGGMPFAARALLNHGLTKPQIAIGMRELRKTRSIIEYHVLNATSPDSLISQHEHTMIIKKDGAEVTTDY